MIIADVMVTGREATRVILDAVLLFDASQIARQVFRMSLDALAATDQLVREFSGVEVVDRWAVRNRRVVTRMARVT